MGSKITVKPQNHGLKSGLNYNMKFSQYDCLPCVQTIYYPDAGLVFIKSPDFFSMTCEKVFMNKVKV